jgi:amino acid transporter
MSVRGAAFLGIGAMVGAGIFALLGEAGAVAGSAVWLSFLLAADVGHLHARGAGVEGVLAEFLDHRGGAVYDLSCRDLLGH